MTDDQTPRGTDPAIKPALSEKPTAAESELDDGALSQVTGGAPSASEITITKTSDSTSPS